MGAWAVAEPGSHEPRTMNHFGPFCPFWAYAGPGAKDQFAARVDLPPSWNLSLCVPPARRFCRFRPLAWLGREAHEDVRCELLGFPGDPAADHPADNTTSFLWHQTIYKSNISAACVDMQW